MQARGVEVLTVVWMLSVMTTLVCELGAVVSRWGLWLAPEAGMLGVLSGVLLFAAAVIGAIALLMTPLVVKLRRHRPPRGILVFAVAVAVVPFIVIFLRLIN